MKLVITNRSGQHAEVRFNPPFRDGTPMTALIPIAARGSASIEGSPAEIQSILDDIARFGVVSAEGADRFDAMRNPNGPPWLGLVYRVDADA